MFTLAVLIVGSISTLAAEESESITHKIDITTQTESKLVKESMTLLGQRLGRYVNISFWIPEGAENINILFDNSQGPAPVINGRIYTYNISSLGKLVNKSLLVDLSYTISKDTLVFQKTLIRDTNSIIVTFDAQQEIYSASNLKSDSSFTIRLYKPSGLPMDWFTVIIILLLIVLLAVFTSYMFKKQKKAKTISADGVESEELLITKKTLLMEILKDIEKKHRAEKISDDTYHKLKNRYKNEAVDAMKKLEDMNSKVK